MAPPALAAYEMTSSPLSSAGSCEGSFVTARAHSPAARDAAATTDPSSPAYVEAGLAALAQYRQAERLPPELGQHYRVYLEENLPLHALQQMNSILSLRPGAPAYCPPPSQLSLLLSIAVHPSFTTRPKEEDWPEVALKSLVYLRSLLTIFGPLHAGFKASMRFASSALSRGGSSDPDSDDEAESPEADERGRVRLSGRYADDSVWCRGQDFFSVVGWAFNCSVLYPNRWRYWKPWLELMLDIIHTDLEERLKLDDDSGCQGRSQLRESILASYLAQPSRRANGGIKWLIKVIFADGGKSASSLFQEVWYNEQKGMSHIAMNKRKREKVNLDAGEYTGWLDNDSVESFQGSEPPTPQKRRKSSGHAEQPMLQSLESAYVESIPLRQRLFKLLSSLCFHLSTESPLDLSELYESFAETTKSLPLPIFSAFVTTTTSALRVDSQVSVYQSMLDLFMPSNALSPSKVDREKADQGGISPAILERCYLPYPANTITAEDNAKVSLLLEQLVQLTWQDGSEEFSADLPSAVATGIEARRAKANRKKTRGRGNAENPDAEAREALEMSGERLTMLAELITQMILKQRL
ncbi:hypothetical protein GGR56DRAFT_671295 [Xylariaceae sp. FL0804]|nr:hypothetical protein GGR56DRAFT_671295 [Xylariaceae sp. FL0804]